VPPPSLTYIGGPTALVEWNGVRLLTDPTFDPPGAEFRSGSYVLRKTQGPALEPDALGEIDAVLLSHDHHFDNLDASGRHFLTRARRVLTTRAAAERLGGTAVGLGPWEMRELTGPGGQVLRVTATPARHGPPHLDRGPVVGFALETMSGGRVVYISGDTVWYEGMADVARRFNVGTAILFLGAARVAAVGSWPLTLTAEDAVAAARAFAGALVVPLHFEGWEHFSESRAEVEVAFARAGLSARLRWPERGKALPLRDAGWS
jgi:L-ascorbate metabolism protein UlaG (beta-lactamase superfamily)